MTERDTDRNGTPPAPNARYGRAAPVKLWVRDDEGVKRSTAIGRLSDVADELDRAKQWSAVSVVAGYVYGPLVDGDDELERVSIALVVDEPADSVATQLTPHS